MTSQSRLVFRSSALLIPLLLAGCYTYLPTPIGPDLFASDQRPSSVRVTLESGESRVLDEPAMRNDSIVGFTDQRAASGSMESVEVGVAIEDVRSLAVPELNVGKTVLSAFGTLVATAALGTLLVLMAMSN